MCRSSKPAPQPQHHGRPFDRSVLESAHHSPNNVAQPSGQSQQIRGSSMVAYASRSLGWLRMRHSSASLGYRNDYALPEYFVCFFTRFEKLAQSFGSLVKNPKNVLQSKAVPGCEDFETRPPFKSCARMRTNTWLG